MPFFDDLLTGLTDEPERASRQNRFEDLVPSPRRVVIPRRRAPFREAEREMVDEDAPARRAAVSRLSGGPRPIASSVAPSRVPAMAPRDALVPTAEQPGVGLRQSLRKQNPTVGDYLAQMTLGMATEHPIETAAWTAATAVSPEFALPLRALEVGYAGRGAAKVGMYAPKPVNRALGNEDFAPSERFDVSGPEAAMEGAFGLILGKGAAGGVAAAERSAAESAARFEDALVEAEKRSAPYRYAKAQNVAEVRPSRLLAARSEPFPSTSGPRQGPGIPTPAASFVSRDVPETRAERLLAARSEPFPSTSGPRQGPGIPTPAASFVSRDVPETRAERLLASGVPRAAAGSGPVGPAIPTGGVAPDIEGMFGVVPPERRLGRGPLITPAPVNPMEAALKYSRARQSERAGRGESSFDMHDFMARRRGEPTVAEAERAALQADEPPPLGTLTARTASGRLPANLARVETDALAKELLSLHEANSRENIAVRVDPETLGEAVYSGMTEGGVRASGRMASREQAIARIEAELTSRGVNPDDALWMAGEGEAADGSTSFDFGPRAGATRQVVVNTLGGGGVFAALGGMVGDTPEERQRNAWLGFMAGAAGGAGAAAAARPISRIIKNVKQAKRARDLRTFIDEGQRAGREVLGGADLRNPEGLTDAAIGAKWKASPRGKTGAVGDVGKVGGSGSPLGQNRKPATRPAVEHAGADMAVLEREAKSMVESLNNEGAWDRMTPGEREAQVAALKRTKAPGSEFGERLYSRAARAINDAPFAKGTAEQWMAALSKGVSKGEREQAGLDAFLTENKGEVLTRDQVAEVFNQNRIRLGEQVYNERRGYGTSGTRYGEYTLPGGENYKETILTLERQPNKAPRIRDNARWAVVNKNDGKVLTTYGDQGTADAHVAAILRDSGGSAEGLKFVVRDLREATPQELSQMPTHWMENNARSYHSSHWSGVDNPLLHIRTKDRIAPDGKKVLHVEELQSDWHQQGRERGYQGVPSNPRIAEIQERLRSIGDEEDRLLAAAKEKGEDVQTAPGRMAIADYRTLNIERGNLADELNVLQSKEGAGVPNAPFKKTDQWVELGLKRILDDAVQGGYDRVAFVTGKQSADRYNLAQYVDDLQYDPLTERLQAFKNGNVIHEGKYDAKALPDVIGKDATKKLLEAPVPEGMDVHQLTGEGLQVGGTGMAEFYDKIVPKVLRDYAKTLGIEIELKPGVKGKGGIDAQKIDQMGMERFHAGDGETAAVLRGVADAIKSNEAGTWREVVEAIREDMASPEAERTFYDVTEAGLSKAEKALSEAEAGASVIPDADLLRLAQARARAAGDRQGAEILSDIGDYHNATGDDARTSLEAWLDGPGKTDPEFRDVDHMAMRSYLGGAADRRGAVFNPELNDRESITEFARTISDPTERAAVESVADAFDGAPPGSTWEQAIEVARDMDDDMMRVADDDLLWKKVSYRLNYEEAGRRRIAGTIERMSRQPWSETDLLRDFIRSLGTRPEAPVLRRAVDQVRRTEDASILKVIDRVTESLERVSGDAWGGGSDVVTYQNAARWLEDLYFAKNGTGDPWLEGASFDITPALAAKVKAGQRLGFMEPAVAGGLGGAAVGAFAGSTQGDTPEERRRNAVAGALSGAVGGTAAFLPGPKTALRRGATAAGVGASGALLSQSDDEKIKATGVGLMGLATVHAIGLPRLKAAGKAAGGVAVEALKTSETGRKVLNLISHDILADPKVKTLIGAYQEGVAFGKARAAELSKESAALGPSADRKISDIIERESFEPTPLGTDQTIALAVAQRVSDEFTALGKAKVGAGLLAPETVAKREGKYLPRMYAGPLAEVATGEPPRAVVGGRKPRIVGDKRRDESLTPAVRTQLGEVREASFRTAVGLEKGYRDVAAAKLFEGLSEIPGVIHPDYKAAVDGWFTARQMVGEDAVWRTAVRDARKEMDALSKQFKDGTDGYVKLPDTPGLGVLRGAVVRKDVADYLNGIPGVSGSAGTAMSLLKTWKRIHTVLNPGTHMGNTVSNSVIAHMSGVPIWGQAIAIRAALKDYNGYGESTRYLAEKGILDRGLPTAGDAVPSAGQQMRPALEELARTTRPATARVLAEGGVTPLSPVRRKLRKANVGAERLYSKEDGVFRVMVFDRLVKGGMTKEAAAKYVDEAFVNYETRSPLLGAIKNTVSPFIMYPVKAIPFVSGQIVEHPLRWMTLAAAWGAMDQYAQNQVGEMAQADLRPSQRTNKYLGYLEPGAIQLPMVNARGDKYMTDIGRWTPFSALTGAPMPGSITSHLSDRVPGIVQPTGPLVEAGARAFNTDPFTGDKWMKPGDDARDKAGKVIGAAANMVLPSALSFHVPRVASDIQNADPRAAAVDALGLIGARPSVVRPGAQGTREARMFEEARRNILADLRYALRANKDPKREAILQARAQRKIEALATQYREGRGEVTP